ncbi:MAG: hypothetical protein ACOYM3_31655 [Terrimicrobiaceae bacterium]
MDPAKTGSSEFLEDKGLSNLPRPLQKQRLAANAIFPRLQTIQNGSFHAARISHFGDFLIALYF